MLCLFIRIISFLTQICWNNHKIIYKYVDMKYRYIKYAFFHMKTSCVISLYFQNQYYLDKKTFPREYFKHHFEIFVVFFSHWEFELNWEDFKYLTWATDAPLQITNRSNLFPWNTIPSLCQRERTLPFFYMQYCYQFKLRSASFTISFTYFLVTSIWNKGWQLVTLIFTRITLWMFN